MTSNIGSEFLLDGLTNEGTVKESVRTQVFDKLKQSFRPEFLNRIDETILFKPLTKENMINIIDLFLNDLKVKLSEQKISLNVTKKAKEYIRDTSYDPNYGARPTKRFIERHLETEISKLLIQGNLKENNTLIIDVQNNQLIYNSEK